MIDWTSAVERALAAHLANGGSGGSRGSAALQPSVPAGFDDLDHGTPGQQSGVPGVPDVTAGTPECGLGVLGPQRAEYTTVQALRQCGTRGTPGTPNSEESAKGTASGSEALDQRAQSEWTKGLLRVAHASPLPAYSPREWQRLLEDGTRFLEQWGVAAARFGWTALDLVGVHPRAPAARYDVMGIIPLIGGDRVVAIDTKSATIRRVSGAELVWPRRAQLGAVPLWDLVPPNDRR